MHLVASDQYLDCSELTPTCCDSINVDLSVAEILAAGGYGYIALVAYDIEGITGAEFAITGWPSGRGAPVLVGPTWCEDALSLGDHEDGGGITAFEACVEPDSTSGIAILAYWSFGPLDSTDLPIDFNVAASTYSDEDSLLIVLDCTVDYEQDDIVAVTGCTVGGIYSGTAPDCTGGQDGGGGGESGDPGSGEGGDSSDDYADGGGTEDNPESGSGSGGMDGGSGHRRTIFSEFEANTTDDFDLSRICLAFRPDFMQSQEEDTLTFGRGVLADSIETLLESLGADVLVKAIPGFTSSDTLLTKKGEEIHLDDVSRVYHMYLENPCPRDSIREVCYTLNDQDWTWFATYCLVAQPFWTMPDDPWTLAQDNLFFWPPSSQDSVSLHALDAWPKCTGDSGKVVIGILDTGIQFWSPEFGASYGGWGEKIVYGWDYGYNSPNYADDEPEWDHQGHGTSVAGIAAALTNNDWGVASLVGGWRPDSLGTQLFVGQIVRNYWPIGPAISPDAACDAVDYAIRSPIDIRALNCSWGNSGHNSWYHEQAKNAYLGGVMLVCARGNSDDDRIYYPACFDDHWILTVTGHNVRGQQARFTSWGKCVDASALTDPIWVLSPYDQGSPPPEGGEQIEGWPGGTSAAAPQALALSALIWSYHPKSDIRDLRLYMEDVQGIIRASAHDLGDSYHFGAGAMDAAKALEMMDCPYRLYHCNGDIGGTVYGQPLETGWHFIDDDFWLTTEYAVKVYEIRKPVGFPVAFVEPPDVWCRGVPDASRGWSLENPNAATPWCEPVPGSITPTGCTMRTYVYDIWRDDQHEDYLGRYPCDFGEVVYGYSVLGLLPPRTWYDDCGQPGQDPHRSLGADYTCSGEDSLRFRTQSIMPYPLWVVYSYEDLCPSASYAVTVCYFGCPGLRINQSLCADGEELHGAMIVSTGQTCVLSYAIDREQYQDGELDLTFRPDGLTDYAAVAWILLNEATPYYGEVPAEDTTPVVTKGATLNGSYPNPFNASTTIYYTLSAPLAVKIEVYDVRGRKVADLVDENQQAGRHAATWDCEGLPSGVYFCRLRTGTQVITRKVVLVE
jgi:hypothetical protein